MPTISVIVPVYKVEKYIHRCVDSILGQTFQDFELILVDDGSPDNCGAICDEYAAKDSRIVVIHQENGGLSAARNAGIDWTFANSDSQWLSFIDSDDWVHPQFLELLYVGAVQCNTRVSCCELKKTADYCCDGVISGYISKIKKPADIYMYCEGKAGGAFATVYLYDKDLFSDIRYPVGKLWEDGLTTPKVIFKVEKIAVVDAPLYYYYCNNEGITKSAWTPRKLDALEAIEFNLDYFAEHKEERLLKQSVRNYFGNISYQYDCVKKSNLEIAEKKEYVRLLRSKLKRAMWKYRELKVISVAEDGNIYGVAWPVLMHCYWVMSSQWNKAKRIFGLR